MPPGASESVDPSSAALRISSRSCYRLRFVGAAVETAFTAAAWRGGRHRRIAGALCLSAVGLAAALAYEREDYAAFPALIALLVLARALPLLALACGAVGGSRAARAWPALAPLVVVLVVLSMCLHQVLCRSAALAAGGGDGAAVAPACGAFAESGALPWLPAAVSLALAPLLLVAALGASAPASAAASLACIGIFVGCCLVPAASGGGGGATIASAVPLAASVSICAAVVARSLDVAARRDFQRAAALRSELLSALGASLASAVLRGQALRLLSALRGAHCALCEVSATGHVLWSLPPADPVANRLPPLDPPSRDAAALAAASPGAVGSQWIGSGVYAPDRAALRDVVQELALLGATHALQRGRHPAAGGAGPGSCHYAGDAESGAVAPAMHRRLRFRRPLALSREEGGDADPNALPLGLAEIDVFAVTRKPLIRRRVASYGLVEQTSVLVIERDVTHEP